MSAITVTQFKTAVWKFISSQVALLVPNEQVAWMGQGVPETKLPYVELKISAGPKAYGGDDMKQISPGTYLIEGQRSFTVLVSIFGPNAEDISALLTSAMSKPSALGSLAADEVAVLTNTVPQNVSISSETNFENRIQFDIVFGCVMAITDDVGFIEHAGIKNTVRGDQTKIG